MWIALLSKICTVIFFLFFVLFFLFLSKLCATPAIMARKDRVQYREKEAYQVPIANTDIYKCSLFSQTIRDWMHFQTLLSPLLKVPRMVLLSSLLWWELGTSLPGPGPGPGPGEWLSFWRVTSNNSDSEKEVGRTFREIVAPNTGNSAVN